MKIKTAKQKKCVIKSCRALFSPVSSWHCVCSPACGKEKFRLDKEKKAAKAKKDFDKETRRMKAELNDKSSSFWEKKAQKACNEFIKFRDVGKPCISCGTLKRGLKYDAGHYISRGSSSALQFELTNIHLQCSWNCNVHLSANKIEYRKALVIKYGAEHVEWLEGHHEMPRYRIEDYKRIFAEFKAKTKQLKIGGN